MKSRSTADSLQSQTCADLARRLASLHQFKPAGDALLARLRPLRPETFSSQNANRKVVTLIEIARKTLTSAGLKLHLFTSCSPALRPHKDVYFDLLRVLRARRPAISEPRIRERADRLLLPLSTRMVVCRAGVAPPEREDPLHTPPLAWPPHVLCLSRPCPRPSSSDASTNTKLMPPPPAPRRFHAPAAPLQFAVPAPRAVSLTHAPRLYARTRAPRRNAPIHFDEKEKETGDTSGNDLKAEEKAKAHEPELDYRRPPPMVQPWPQQQMVVFSTPGFKTREQAPGHRRRRSVRGF